MDEVKRAEKIAEAQERYDQYLLGFPNVVGTGIGFRQRDSQPASELCLVVMVSRKLAPAELPAHAVLPRELDGLPVDVLETGAFGI